ncbi:MAG: hypothetical protein QM762_08715 [Chryseolinea sp.]
MKKGSAGHRLLADVIKTGALESSAILAMGHKRWALTELIESGYVQRVYIITDAGREAHANTVGEVKARAKPKSKRAAQPREAAITDLRKSPDWGGYPPVTSIEAMDALKNSVQSWIKQS